MGPLTGVRIVELAGIGPGPFACMLLADMGAEIIRIERPGRGRDTSTPSGDPLLRGRPALVVDLKCPEGVAFVLDLVARADILIEGFRPGVTERIGLGPQACHTRNAALVYGRMTGWGQSGPLAHAAGHDINYIALTGVLHAVGERGGKPVVPLNLVGDFGGGALYLALGVVSALLEARQSGHGQVVDAAIVDGAASLMAMMYGKLATGRWRDSRGDNGLDGGAPWYDTYQTADGGYLALGAIEPVFFDKLAQVLGLDPSWNQRRHDRDQWPALRQTLARHIGESTRDAWQSRLEGTDACAAPVLSMGEASAHPHLRQRQVFVEIDGITQPAPAPRFSRTPGQIRRVPETPDDAWMASNWQCDPCLIERLRARGIIGSPIAAQAS